MDEKDYFLGWDGLRGLWHKKRAEANRIRKEYESQSFWKKLFSGFFSPPPEASFNGIDKFICPHCLKAVMVNQLQVICPYCNKEEAIQKGSISKDDSLLDIIAEGTYTLMTFARLQDLIFHQCNDCKGILQYIECPHCENAIDLFAPYDEKKLENQRYKKSK